jgi:hypothetical protein
VTEEDDIWRAAKLLVDRLGGDARAHAEIRASELLKTEDRISHALWTDIIRAIDHLLPPTPKGSPD